MYDVATLEPGEERPHLPVRKQVAVAGSTVQLLILPPPGPTGHALHD